MSENERQSGAGQRPMPVAKHLAIVLWTLGVREAWGVCGREIVPMWSALLESEGTPWEIATRHARHENGAGFAAIGSWMQTDRPTAIFATTGPGLTNVITSLETARATGAKFILLSPVTPAVERGRLGIQATGPGGYANADLNTPGRIFDLVATIESADQLTTLGGPLASGFAGVGGFSAHLALPTTLQPAMTDAEPALPAHRRPAPGIAPTVADELVDLLASEPFAVWLGWGARRYATAVRRLLDVTGAPAVCSPRGVGIADRHPQFLGTTGNGSRASLARDLVGYGVRRTLVLGSALGEATSGWDPALVPPEGFIHVDLNAGVFGRAYPQAPTLGVQGDTGQVLKALLTRSDRLVRRKPRTRRRSPAEKVERKLGVVHPIDLMSAIQRILVDGSDMPIIADASSAMFWAVRHLSFPSPNRFFVEGHFGAMGQAGAVVVGAASGRGGSAAAICGDGSLHMQDEINTAVRYGIRAIWIVLNDGGLGIVRAGMRLNNRPLHDGDYPPTDFAAVARDKGAKGTRVKCARDLDAALQQAVEARDPFLVDVLIDPTAVPPIEARAKR